MFLVNDPETEEYRCFCVAGRGIILFLETLRMFTGEYNMRAIAFQTTEMASLQGREIHYQ